MCSFSDVIVNKVLLVQLAYDKRCNLRLELLHDRLMVSLHIPVERINALKFENELVVPLWKVGGERRQSC